MSLGGGGRPTKDQIMQNIQQETAMANARSLVTSINETCYEKCVPKPGASLSSGEEKCMSQCMEKYMAAWTTVSRTYVARLQQEQQQRGPIGGIGSGGGSF